MLFESKSSSQAEDANPKALNVLDAPRGRLPVEGALHQCLMMSSQKLGTRIHAHNEVDKMMIDRTDAG